MKMRTRNIIAFTVAAVAVLSIVFVIVLAVIRIEPLKGMLDCSSYEIRYGTSGKPYGNTTDVDYKIISNKPANRKYESVTMRELVGMCGFSVFKSWSQFKYNNGPKITDHYETSHPSINRSEMKDIISGSAAAVDGKFSFVFRFSNTDTLKVTDWHGAEYSQSYDAVIVILDETDGAVRDITMYVYEQAKLVSSYDNDPSIKDDAVGYKLFYPLQVGAVTSEAIDALYDIYNIDPDAKEEETPEEKAAE